MYNISTYEIECALLNSFISVGESIEYNSEPFKMESKYFTSDFNKTICERVMKHLEDKASLSLFSIKMEAWVRDVSPSNHQNWFNIVGRVPIPMTIAKQYYEHIKINEIERLSNGR